MTVMIGLRLVVVVGIGWSLAAGCSSGSSGSGSGGAASGDPAAGLNAGVVLPSEGAALDAPETDDSVDVQAAGAGQVELSPGDTITVSVPFSAPNGNVVGAGIRFGTTGPIRVVDVPSAKGLTQGTLTFDVKVPTGICGSLSSICHAVKCYEFAVTAAGKISKANINSVALKCGGCDEPSCQSLLTSCGSSNNCKGCSNQGSTLGSCGTPGSPAEGEPYVCRTGPPDPDTGEFDYFCATGADCCAACDTIWGPG